MQNPSNAPIPPIEPQRLPAGQIEGDTTGGLIPYKNASALASYYVGLFSLIPCIGLPMGVTAVILGVKGLRYAKENPVVKGQAHAWVGIICGGFWALVYGVSIVFTLIAMLTRN